MEKVEKHDVLQSKDALHENQSTVVAMVTPEPGSVLVSSAGGPIETTRMMEVLDFIEVCVCTCACLCVCEHLLPPYY
jgi:hypothetical protein